MLPRMLAALLAGILLSLPRAAAADSTIPDAGVRIDGWTVSDTCREAQAAKQAGFPWVSYATTWEALEPQPGSYLQPGGDAAWTDLTSRLKCAKNLGLKVQLNLGNPPAWASGRTGRNDPPLPENVPHYGMFLKDLVARIGPLVDVWTPWNEPNFNLFWAPPHDPALYVDIQKTAYQAIKAADPGATVSSAPVVGTATSSATPAWDYLDDAFKLGLGRYADLIAFNFYPRDAPEAVVTDSRGRPAAWALTSQPYLRQLVDRYAPGLPIWITETGHSTCVNCTASAANALSEAQQADYLVRMFTYRRRYLTGVTDRIFWYETRDSSTDRTDWFANLGLLHNDFSPKPAYSALAQLRVAAPATGGGPVGGGGTPVTPPRLPRAAGHPPLPSVARSARRVRVRLSRITLRARRGVISMKVRVSVSTGAARVRVEGFRSRRWRAITSARIPRSALVRLRFTDRGYLGIRVLARPATERKWLVSRVARVP